MENPFDEEKKMRPTLLTVLCILTFIGSGWGILSHLFSLLTAGMVDSSIQMEQYTNMMDSMGGDSGSSFLSGLMSSSMEILQATALYAKQIAISGLVLSVISLLGSIFMYRLQRIGFYLYVAAQIVMLFVLPVFAGFSWLAISSMLFSGVVTAVFIILYGINLKYLRN